MSIVRCTTAFSLGIWLKVLITVNQEVDFLSCKKIKNKKEILLTSRPWQTWVTPNFFAMTSKFSPLAFGNNSQNTKSLWNTSPHNFSFWKHWNISSQIFTCSFLLFLKSSSKAIWFSVMQQILQILSKKTCSDVMAHSSSSLNTWDLAYAKSARGLAQLDSTGVPGASLACTAYRAVWESSKPGARRSLLPWDVGSSGRGTSP